VLTRYIDELNQAIQAGLERRGPTVVHIAGLDITDNFGICSVTPREIIAFAERELTGRAFDLLFVSCTNFRAVEARLLLQQRFDVPVVTTTRRQLTRPGCRRVDRTSGRLPVLALFAPDAMSDLSPLCEQKRTSANHFETMVHALTREEDDHSKVRLISLPKSFAALKLEARL
jgi:hypothetical protein